MALLRGKFIFFLKWVLLGKKNREFSADLKSKHALVTKCTQKKLMQRKRQIWVLKLKNSF